MDTKKAAATQDELEDWLDSVLGWKHNARVSKHLLILRATKKIV